MHYVYHSARTQTHGRIAVHTLMCVRRVLVGLRRHAFAGSDSHLRDTSNIHVNDMCADVAILDSHTMLHERTRRRSTLARGANCHIADAQRSPAVYRPHRTGVVVSGLHTSCTPHTKGRSS